MAILYLSVNAEMKKGGFLWQAFFPVPLPVEHLLPRLDILNEQKLLLAVVFFGATEW